MSFYYPSQTNNSVLKLYFDYSLVANKTITTGNINSQFLIFNAPLGASFIPPDILAITYNIQNQAISATCADGLCAFGSYSMTPYLSFTLQDSGMGAITQLHAANKEWKFPDDAPSVSLCYLNTGNKPGGIALQSAMTQRNYCEILKVRLSSRTPDFATLAPLGVFLMAQQTYQVE